jgi:hypothetical protein
VKHSRVILIGLLLSAMFCGCAIEQAKQAATKADSEAASLCAEAMAVHAQACVRACIPKPCAKNDQSCNKALDACAEKNPECKLTEPCAKAEMAGANGADRDYWSRACVASMRSDPVCGDAIAEAQQAHADVQRARQRFANALRNRGGSASSYGSPAYLQMQNQAMQQQAQQMQLQAQQQAQQMQQQGQEQMREMRPTQVEIVP